MSGLSGLKSISPMRWCQIGAGILVVSSFFFSGADNLREGRQRGDEIRAQRQALQAKEDEFSFDVKEAELAATVANIRYQEGCIFVVATNNPDVAVSIVENEPVIDLTTKQPLANTSIVCDFTGGTGIIRNGVVSSFAFTGNAEVINAAKARAGFDVSESSTGN